MATLFTSPSVTARAERERKRRLAAERARVKAQATWDRRAVRCIRRKLRRRFGARATVTVTGYQAQGMYLWAGMANIDGIDFPVQFRAHPAMFDGPDFWSGTSVLLGNPYSGGAIVSAELLAQVLDAMKRNGR